MGAIGGAFGVLFLLGSIPLSTLADRYPRKLVAAVSMAVWSVVVFATGLVQNAFWLFIARLGTGVGQSYALPVNAPLLIDTYPIPARSRVFAAYGSFEIAGRVLGPLFAGAVAGRGRRARELALGLRPRRPARASRSSCCCRSSASPGGAATRCRRCSGRSWPPTERELPISLGVAFERLRKIRTFHFFLAGMAALGFALFSIPLFLNLYLEDELGLSAWERGVFGAAVALPGIVALAVAAPRVDRLFRASPPAAVVFVGSLIAVFGVLIVAGLYMPNVVLVGVFYAVGVALSQAALATTVAVTGSVIPYRLRSRGTAMVGVYVFLFGGFFGAVLTGLLSDAVRPAGRAHARGAPRHAARRRADRLRRPVHPGRHLALRRGAARGEGRARPGGGRGERGAGHPGAQPRLLVRHRAGAVRREPRRAAGRDAGAARHQRGGQVDAAAGDQRPRRRRAGGWCACTAARSPTPTPSCGPASASCSSWAATRCSGRSRSTRTCGWRGSSTTAPTSSAASTPRSSASRRWPRGAAPPRPTCRAGSSRCWRWRWPSSTSPRC